MSSIFRINSTSSIITIADTDYTLDNFTSIQIEVAKTQNLLLSYQDNSNDNGTPYAENLGQGTTLTILIRNVPTGLYAALVSAFDTNTRIDYSAVDVSAENQIVATDGIITTNPHNRTIDGSETFTDVNLVMKFADRNFDYGSIS